MSDFKYYEGYVSVNNLFAKLKELVTTPFDFGANNWTVANETSTSLTLKLETNPNSLSETKEAYIQFTLLTAERKGNGLKVQYAEGFDTTAKTLLNPSPESYFMIGTNSGYVTEIDYTQYNKALITRPSTTRCRYCLSINNDYMALYMQGTPEFDYSYYYEAFLYFGALIPFNEQEDVDGNIVLTCSCNSEATMKNVPKTGNPTNDYGALTQYGEYSYERVSDKPFGIFTSKGMADISMLKTYSGLMYQSHFPSILNGTEAAIDTPSTGENKVFFGKSNWTSKFHASPVYVVHPYDGYRGYLHNIIAISSQNLIESDILQENVGTEQAPVYETYRLVNVNKNNPVTFMNALSNTKYILAIKKP